MLEKEIQNKVIQYARSKNVLCIKQDNSVNRGLPDYILIFDGLCIFMEFKSDEGVLSAIQEAMHNIIRDKHDTEVFVIKDIKKGIQYVNELIKDADFVSNCNCRPVYFVGG